MDIETSENIQLDENQALTNKEFKHSYVLIAESEPELGSLFEAYLSSRGLKAQIANDGKMAMDCFWNSKEKNRPYDAVLVDTHLSNPSGIDVAKNIRREKPDQKIVLVTTTPKENLPADCLQTAGIKDTDILTIPFRMSNLESILKNN